MCVCFLPISAKHFYKLRTEFIFLSSLIELEPRCKEKAFELKPKERLVIFFQIGRYVDLQIQLCQKSDSESLLSRVN